jgi:6-phosphofructokinase 1
MKTVGIMTSGGDAPGMNAAIRAACRIALNQGFRVLGFLRGYEGIIQEQTVELSSRSVSNVLQRGGTILRTARSNEFLTVAGQKKAAHSLQHLKVDALILIGGDGTFRGGADLANVWSGQLIGVPATIDNDLCGTDRTIGFDTAVNTALEAIDKIRDTADSHERFFLVEVMGRSAGFIAMEVGLTGGAEEILIPEEPVDIKAICRRLCEAKHAGKTSSIIVVAEGAFKGGAYAAAESLKKLSGNEYRVCVLGHLQRGGCPTAADRLLASKLAAFAVQAVVHGETGKMAGEMRGEMALVPFDQTWTPKKSIPPWMGQLARDLAT